MCQVVFRQSLYVLVIAAACLCAACESRHVGQDAKLLFIYESPFEHETFNKPVVVGGRLSILLGEPGSTEDRELHIESVDVQPEGVFKVHGHAANLFEVEALWPGEVTFTVRATNEDGELLTDSVRMRSARMAKSHIALNCQRDAEVAYMLASNTSFFVDIERYASSGERLSGYGHAPVRVSPDSAHVVRPVTSQELLEVDVSQAQGDVSLSLMDDTLTLKRVHEGDVTHLEPVMDVPESMLAGYAYELFLAPYVGAHELCEPKWHMQAVSRSPEVCEVSVDEDGAPGALIVQAMSVGECRVRVSMQGGRAGYEASWRVGKIVFDAQQETGSDEPERSQPPWWLASLLAMLLPGVPAWYVMRRWRA